MLNEHDIEDMRPEPAAKAPVVDVRGAVWHRVLKDIASSCSLGPEVQRRPKVVIESSDRDKWEAAASTTPPAEKPEDT